MPELAHGLDHDPIFCPECGAVLGALQEVIEMQRCDIANLEADIRSKRAQIRQLKGEQGHHPDTDAVLDHWSERLHPAAREIHSAARRRPTSARLRGGYDADALRRCIDGYALKPYVVNGRRAPDGPKDSWRAEPSLIFRDPWHVDQGIAIADEADSLRTLLSAKSGDLRPCANSDDPGPTLLSRMASAAVSVARKGRLIFPCKPNSKEPATRNGFKDAKRDETAIVRTWTQHPDLNLAIPTGALNGLVVLDIDVRDDVGWETWHRLEARYGDWPPTLSVTTPSGGQHFYFQHPGVTIANRTGYPGPGIDIRGDGGYVLIPPSVIDGRPYEVDEEIAPAPMPRWLVDQLLAYQAKLARELSGPNARDRYIELICAGTSQGQRDDACTRYAGHLFAMGMTSREVYATVLSANDRCRPPMADRQVRKIVRSIGSRQARR